MFHVEQKDVYKLINQSMEDLKWYTQDELSELVGFKVTMRSIKALKKRWLIIEHEKKYQTTQSSLFTTTETTKTICSRNNR